LKFQASENSIDTHGAIGFVEKKKEEREGRKRRERGGCAWRTESTARWGPPSEAQRE
jgi:hypothetical protein